MKSILTVSFVVLSICVFAQSKKSDPLAEAKAAIAESNAIYFTAFERHDASIFVDRYADDACIMMPNAPQLCGANEVANFFKAAYDQFGLRGGKFITTAVYGDGNDYVTEEGLWQSLNEKGELIDDGKFLVLWKKTSKGWKMYRDSFSSNRQQ
jgi:ketosteroid isomerase-like protein